MGHGSSGGCLAHESCKAMKSYGLLLGHVCLFMTQDRHKAIYDQSAYIVWLINDAIKYPNSP